LFYTKLAGHKKIISTDPIHPEDFPPFQLTQLTPAAAVFDVRKIANHAVFVAYTYSCRHQALADGSAVSEFSWHGTASANPQNDPAIRV
jgi:hypothetical protein